VCRRACRPGVAEPAQLLRSGAATTVAARGSTYPQAIRYRLLTALLAFLIAGSVWVSDGDARLTLTYCKTAPGNHYLLVHQAGCREGRAVVHTIIRRKPQIGRLPYVGHVDGWTCRIGKGTIEPGEHSIRCRRKRVDQIWANIRLPQLSSRRWVPTGGPSSDEAGPPPGRLPTSALYTGRGNGIEQVSLRLRGHELIEAKVVYVEHCTTTGDGHRRHYRLRQESDQATRRLPARVDRRGGFRVERSEVNFASDELERFVGTVTQRSIVGELALESHESAPESGIFDTCHTGPYPPALMRALTFRARRR
jgi:hypothetical protein